MRVLGVVDVGQVSTPLFNFACANYDQHAGGIMVTASHNPAKYNGFKLTLGNGLPIGEAFGMAEIKELVKQSQYVFLRAMLKLNRKMFEKIIYKKYFPLFQKRLCAQ
jgi:phosphomannomutase